MMSKNIVLIVAAVLLAFAAAFIGEPQQAQETYEIVGYNYVFTLDGDEVQINYVDWYGDDEVRDMEASFMSMLPGAKGVENPVPGTIVVTTKRCLSLDEFNAFVDGAKDLIYDQIF